MTKCCKCGKEASMEITNIYANGEKEIKHYCTTEGKLIFRNLFREMYGLKEKPM